MCVLLGDNQAIALSSPGIPSMAQLGQDLEVLQHVRHVPRREPSLNHEPLGRVLPQPAG